MVASLAPPCSGPLRAPMAPVMAEWMSARVAAMTRAAKVLAFSSWSACRISAMSKARVAVSEGFSPLSIQRKLAGVRERAVGFDDWLAFADAIEDGDDHGDLRGEAVGLADVGVVRLVGFVGVVDAEQRDGGAQHLHRRGAGGDAAQEVDDLGVELAGGGEMRGELGEFGGVGQLAEPEQVGGLFEGGALGELVDVDAAVGEDAGVSVDPADGGVGGDDAFQAFRCDSSGHKTASPE